MQKNLHICKKSSIFAANLKKIIVILALCGLWTAPLGAETLLDRTFWKHELRLGWGDQLFETLRGHQKATVVTTMGGVYVEGYHENFHYDQHLWMEYQYRHNDWFSFGGMVDLSEVHWDEVYRNGAGEEVMRDPGHYFYNVILMPTARFTYFHHDYVNLYSGVGLGIGINGGSEMDIRGKKTDVGAAVDVIVLGMSANYKQWFMAVDLGGLYSLKDSNTIFLASSKIIRASIGVRF